MSAPGPAQPRKPSWLWPLVAGACAVVIVIVATLAGRLPISMLRVLRPGTAPLDLRGGSRLVFRVPPEHAERMDERSWRHLASTLRTRGSSLGVDVEVHRVGDEIIVDLDGAQPEDRSRFQKLTRRALLEFQMVDEGSDLMLRLARRAEEDGEAATRGIRAGADSWMHEDSGRRFQDGYLRGPDEKSVREWLAAAAAGDPSLAVDSAHEILFERVEPRADVHDGDRAERAPYVRTHLLHREVILDSTHIDDAVVEWDRITNRPQVLVTFSADGARRFGDATAANVGQKLAIIVDDQVMSAPVIQSPIRGGRCTITMGGGDPRVAQAEASDLAAALRAGALPIPLELIAVHDVSATLTRAHVLLYGAIWALILGAVVAAAGRLAQRMRLPVSPTPPGDPTAPAPVGPQSPERRRQAVDEEVVLWLRCGVTLGAVLLINLAHRVRLPGINHVELRNLSAGTGVPAFGSVFDLGLAPVLAAFVLVELAALAVPGWRRLRTGGPEARARLAEPTAVLALLLALFQGWMAARWYQSARFYGGEVMPDPGLVSIGVVTLSLAAGTLVLVVLAAAVSRWGLVNGYSLLLVAPLLGRPVNYLLGLFNLGEPGNVGPTDFLRLASSPEPPTMFHRAVELGAYAGVAVLTLWCLRRRARLPDGPSLRLPAAGLIPLHVGAAILGVIGLVGLLGAPTPVDLSPWLSAHAFQNYAAHALLIALFAAGLAVLFALPLPGRAGGPGLAFAVLSAAAYALAVDFAHQVTTRLPHTFFSAVEIAVATAVIADLIAEWSARRRLGPLVDVWPLHQVHHADHVAAALSAAGIPCHLRSTGHRSLLHVVGPYVPVSILVPVDRAQAAIEVVIGALQARPPGPALPGRDVRSDGSLAAWPPKQS